MVNKSPRNGRMSINYTDLDQAYSEDSGPLPNLDKFVNNPVGYKLLQFMGFYSGYGQIPMLKPYWKEIVFIIWHANHQYNETPF